jgi:hypothetical protein
MFHRCILLLLGAGLAVSGGAVWATGLSFVDISALNTSTTVDLQSCPMGVGPGGTAVLAGAKLNNANYYDVCYYSGGTSGTMSNINSHFTTTISGAGTPSNSCGSSMNDQGNFTSCFFTGTPAVGWLTSNGGTTVTSFVQHALSGTTYQTRAIGLDDNGDISGVCIGTTGTIPYVSVGGTVYTLPYTSTTAQYASAVNTQGYACGFGIGGSPPTDYAVVYNYTISGGTMTSSSVTPLSGTVGGVESIKSVIASVPGWSGVNGTDALAINSPASGSPEVVVTASPNSVSPRADADTGVFLYNVGTKAATLVTSSSLGNLLLYDPYTTVYEGTGHGQCIDNAGDVVGYTGTQGSSWHASMWVPDANGDGGGTIEDLNTVYGPSGLNILPANVTLNCASAIDNNGDISGVCTVGGTALQSFVIYGAAATPEPGTLLLCLAGVAGLAAYAWRKGKGK